MRRNPGLTHGGASHLASALARSLQPNPFTDAPTQWGKVAALHGTTSTTLSATVGAGVTIITTAASPAVNDYLIIGTLVNTPIRVTTVSGTGPFTVTLAQQLPTGQTSGATVVAAKTLDVYLDGSQVWGDTTFLTTGIRYLSTYSPTVNDIIVILRGASGSMTDRLALGKLA